MKITRVEKIWLFITVLFYGLYILPGLPGLGNAKGMMIHACLTIVPLWLSAYIFMPLVYKKYKLREKR